MRLISPDPRAATIAIAALAVGAAIFFARAEFQQQQPVARERLGMMSSLPIYWAEGAGIDDFVNGKAQLPWVRKALEARFDLTPLDTLSPAVAGQADAPAQNPLAGLSYLLIAQPRGISPADNAALDGWVRAGGHLLYVLDPMLTGSYTVPLGDPRHPASVGLLPPVLPHWGLQMLFTERQPFELHEVMTEFGPVPIMMAGQIELTDVGKQHCNLDGGGLVATCQIEKGRVTLLADAALFELPHGNAHEQDMLLALTEHAFE